jgi:hypothetical protein
MRLTSPPTRIGRYRLDSADFALRWPPSIFEAEGTTLLDDTATGRQELLLEEAFAGPIPAQALRDAAGGSAPGSKSRLMDALVSNVSALRRERPKVPYYSRRARGGEPLVVDPFTRLIAQFVDLIGDLLGRGYFDHLIAPRPCVDAGVNAMEDYIAGGSQLFERELGRHVSWPLRTDQLVSANRDLLFDVIEVLHDRVARPRDRTFHDYCDCGWHYSDFGIETGRQLYQWRVNQLLDTTSLGYRLADDGEDIGRLVTTTDEARTELLQIMAERTGFSTDERVEHAVSLFRRRGATDEDKRSACIALAGVLEERRDLLKDKLTSPDEGALFTIANKFAIRHRRADQSTAYDPIFLDWVFWAYLSTVELTNRLLSVRSGTTAP